MSEKEKEKIDVLIEKVDEIKIEVDTIKRGIYGDHKNRVAGLIDRQDLDERRIAAIEDHQRAIAANQKKFFAIVGGIVVSLEVVWNFIKHQFIK